MVKTEKTLDPKVYLKKMAEDQKAQLIKEGKRPYFTIPEGETELTVDLNEILREKDGDFGKQYIYRISVKGEEYDLPASLSLSKRILTALSDGKNPMVIIRAGEAKQTRYSIKK